jgi:hypothetical protein
MASSGKDADPSTTLYRTSGHSSREGNFCALAPSLRQVYHMVIKAAEGDDRVKA